MDIYGANHYVSFFKVNNTKHNFISKSTFSEKKVEKNEK